MAKSNYEYVKEFETPDSCLPNTWIVVRIDGRCFSEFSQRHAFNKPNDAQALALMNRAAQRVFLDHPDMVLAYGQSDEYSFVFKKDTTAFNRRGSKLMSTVVSLFSSCYVFEWTNVMGSEAKLLYPPTFDARVVLYPSSDNLRHYLSWRQVDCHINNLYNTCFWKLVQEGGLTTTAAEERLKGTVSADKNELLFSQFNCNYNNEPEMFRKGTVIVCKGKKKLSNVRTLHVDIIGDQFWKDYPHLLQLATV